MLIRRIPVGLKRSLYGYSVINVMFCILLLLPSAATAIDANGDYVIRGVGSKDGSCGEYVRADVTSRRWYESWLMGYISGVNTARSGKEDFSNAVPPTAIGQWLDNYCKGNPMATFHEAVEAMISELKRRR